MSLRAFLFVPLYFCSDFACVVECSGVEVCAAVRKAGFMLPILAMTAHVDVQSISKYKEVGFNGLVGKPFTVDWLAKQLTKMCTVPAPAWSE